MELNMRVLSFCHYLQGPAATQYLADLGADVIKVEPLNGSFERHWSGGKSFVNGVSAFLLSANRNKRSISINLKESQGIEIILKILKNVDIIVENFRPGVMEKLGLGYEQIKSIKPDIIYASATGLGATGPDYMRPGQDLLMQARSGLVSVTGGEHPTVIGAAVVDQHGASILAMGILGALIKKLQTGKGSRVETSLLQSAIDLQTEALTKYFARSTTGDVTKRGKNVGSWYHDAPYGAYCLVDCNIVLSMNDPYRLADALNSDVLQKLANIDRYLEREKYASAVAKELEKRTLADVAERFQDAGIWFEKIQSYDELLEDPQLKHIGAFIEHKIGDRTVRLVSHPIKYDGVCPKIETIPLQHGVDTRDILLEIGMKDNQIDKLIKDGIIAEAKNVT